MVTGNSAKNIHNRGYYSLKDNILYFSNDHDGEGLYIHNLTTGLIRHLTNYSVDMINIGPEWIYFRATDWQIFKIKPDNSDFGRLTPYPVREVLLIGDYLYHTNDDNLIRINITNDRKQFLKSGERVNHLTEFEGNLLYVEEGNSIIYQLNAETLETTEFRDVGHFYMITKNRLYYSVNDDLVSEKFDGTDHRVHYKGYEGASPLIENNTDQHIFFSVCFEDFYESGVRFVSQKRKVFKVPINGGSASLFIDKENAHSLNVIGSKVYYIHGWAFHEIEEDGSGHQIKRPIFYRRPKSAETVRGSILDQVINKPNARLQRMITRTRQYYMYDSMQKVERFLVAISHHPSIALYKDHNFQRHDANNELWAFELTHDYADAITAKKMLIESGMKDGECDEAGGLYVYCFFSN